MSLFPSDKHLCEAETVTLLNPHKPNPEAVPQYVYLYYLFIYRGGRSSNFSLTKHTDTRATYVLKYKY